MFWQTKVRADRQSKPDDSAFFVWWPGSKLAQRASIFCYFHLFKGPLPLLQNMTVTGSSLLILKVWVVCLFFLLRPRAKCVHFLSRERVKAHRRGTVTGKEEKGKGIWSIGQRMKNGRANANPTVCLSAKWTQVLGPMLHFPFPFPSFPVTGWTLSSVSFNFPPWQK